MDTGTDVLLTQQPKSCVMEISGLLMSLAERRQTKTTCVQEFADIALDRSNGTMTINSFFAHFAIDVSAAPTPNKVDTFEKYLHIIPPDFDSQTTMAPKWEPEAEHSTPYGRLQLRDQHGNSYQSHHPRWFDHWPPLRLDFPRSLRGSTLRWLLAEGIELIRIMELKLLKAPDGLEPFHIVICLGLDRRATAAAARRFGTFYIPVDVWDKAGWKPTVVTLH